MTCAENFKEYHRQNPWAKYYRLAKRRCTDKNHPKYKYYGGRGIKFKLTKEDIKDLWFRDKAFKLKHPSIDRIKQSNNYIKNNCRFIELENNTACGRERSRITRMKQIIQKNKRGHMIKVFESASQASKFTGVHSTNIRRCANKQQKTAGGFTWEDKK